MPALHLSLNSHNCLCHFHNILQNHWQAQKSSGTRSNTFNLHAKS